MVCLVIHKDGDDWASLVRLPSDLYMKESVFVQQSCTALGWQLIGATGLVTTTDSTAAHVGRRSSLNVFLNFVQSMSLKNLLIFHNFSYQAHQGGVLLNSDYPAVHARIIRVQILEQASFGDLCQSKLLETRPVFSNAAKVLLALTAACILF